MFEELPIELISTLTPSALLGMCILFILVGRIVPLRSHERELSIRDQEIEYLRTALSTCHDAELHRSSQVSELLEHSRIATAIIRSLTVTDEEVPM